ncbi:antitoxin Xre-like helix-turn-helix domain-containing protein [Shewanella marina]|uniref:antitoxin Xre-like helix-turn-helix domain-containing protein n=1 Tax=Shewanella marina TaxID=487319 RepID=UPI00055D1B8E|nr:antitoxin Xre-like helix-turn-helix domain-containing protein [Shewanella marina]
MLANVQTAPSNIDISLALPVVFNILDKWQCSAADQMTLLGVNSRTTLAKYRKAKTGGITLSADLAERMSYILHIHKCLRKLFSLEHSVYDWVNKPNQHPFFNGRSAMNIMKGGKVADLYEVSKHLQGWSGVLS